MRHAIIISTFILIAFSSEIYSQNDILHLLRKYKNDSGVLYFDAVSLLKNKITSTSDLKSEITAADIYVFEGVNDVSASDKKKMNDFVQSKTFELLMDIKQKGTESKLFVKEKGNFLEELVGIMHYDDYHIYIFAKGKIIYDELAKLGLNFNQGDGLELFDKVRKKDKS
ncbi:MAG: DUF4252 domain-containing protein [Saprospiraceae bacterium]